MTLEPSRSLFSLPQNKSMKTRCGWEHVDGKCPLKTCPHDAGSRELSRGDLVLDDGGRPWRIPRFSYGRENIAVCEGVAYNHREQAVRLGSTLRIEDAPTDAKAGKIAYQQIFDALDIGEKLREEVRERRKRFQDTLGPNRKE